MALSLSRFKVIRRWKEFLPKIYKVVKEFGFDAYLIGSVARGNYDCSSDFDLAIVVERELSREERIKLKLELEEALEREGIPTTFPIEIHLVKPDELRKYKERIPLEKLMNV